MQKEENFIIEKLKLIPHPEGGYYREIYRSNEIINSESLPARYNANRSFSTSIFYMLTGDQVSQFHRLKSDEIWHHYKGSAILLHCFEEDRYTIVKIGNNIDLDEQPQFVIRTGVWFAAEVQDKNSFSFIGCTAAPGFDFADLEFADRNDLIKHFPNHSELIQRFTNE